METKLFQRLIKSADQADKIVADERGLTIECAAGTTVSCYGGDITDKITIKDHTGKETVYRGSFTHRVSEH